MTDGWYSEATATFGDRVLAAREAAGVEQRDLALRLGVALRTVRAWEDDQSEPRANRMQMLAGVLGVSLRWLMTGEGPGVPSPEAGEGGPGRVEAMRAELVALRGLLRQANERAQRLDRRLAEALGER
jgi:transcriptional regulator with XRE-family HTH domain